MIVLAEIDDPVPFLAYARAAAELVTRFGGRYVVRAPKASVVLEGAWPDTRKVVVSEWPSMAMAQAFFESAEYAEVRKLREGAARVEIRLVEGV
jgi:uncharacterized protein (DUF1330 family)